MYWGAIRSLLLIVTLLSASWAAFGAVSGTAVSAILVASAVYFLVKKSRWSGSIRVAAIFLGLSALVGLAVPAVNGAREAAHGMQCENQLRQIGIAVRAYWDEHGCYPHTCTYDNSGRPMYSWRLLIKEFLVPIPHKYDYNEPWDSPGNRSRVLLDHRLAHLYQCPADQAACTPGSTLTSYVALIGKRAPLRYGKFETTDQELRSPSPFLVIEMADSGIQWSEPKDIRFDDLQALQSLAAKCPHTRDNGYFFYKSPAVNAVLVNGDMVLMFPWDTKTSVLTGLLPPRELLLPPEELRRIEKNRLDKSNVYYDRFQEELRVNWPHVVGLPVWVVAVALLAYQRIVASRRVGVSYRDR
jgi:uncharacterized protein DUF1559